MLATTAAPAGLADAEQCARSRIVPSQCNGLRHTRTKANDPFGLSGKVAATERDFAIPALAWRIAFISLQRWPQILLQAFDGLRTMSVPIAGHLPRSNYRLCLLWRETMMTVATSPISRRYSEIPTTVRWFGANTPLRGRDFPDSTNASQVTNSTVEFSTHTRAVEAITVNAVHWCWVFSEWDHRSSCRKSRNSSMSQKSPSKCSVNVNGTWSATVQRIDSTHSPATDNCT